MSSNRWLYAVIPTCAAAVVLIANFSPDLAWIRALTERLVP